MRGIRIIALIALVIAAVGEARAQTTPNGPPLWRIWDADSTVWILGSVHLLPPGIKWRNARIDAALSDVEIVYFEVSADAANEAEAQRTMLALGLNPPGATLSDSLSSVGRQRLARVAKQVGLPVARLDRLRPWFAYLLLELNLLADGGAQPELGVDATMERLARADRKELRYLETPSQQIRFLSDLSEDAQRALLEASLEVFDDRPDVGETLIDAWARGDDAELEALVFEGREMFPEYFETLFTRRNRAWAWDIDEFLDQSGDALFVVGAGHLLGEEGVPALLRQMGHDVERR